MFSEKLKTLILTVIFIFNTVLFGIAGIAHSNFTMLPGASLSTVTAFSGDSLSNYYLPYGNIYGIGWFDANKTSANTEDDYMCWAAAASNILDWGNWGTSPFISEDEIWQNYQYHWTDEGGIMEYAWRWWFDGTNPPLNGGSQVDVLGGGNHYPGFNFDDYYHRTWQDNLAVSAIDSYLQSGYGVTIGIYTSNGGGHALSIWGYQYTDLGVITDIIFSDSDDYQSGDGSTKNLWITSINKADERWYLGNSSWYIGEVMALEAKPVPLPCSFLLLFTGLLGIPFYKFKMKKE